MSTLPANTPILVCFASLQQKTTDLSQSDEATTLMSNASINAANSVNCPELLKQCERIYVPEGMWAYKDPARIVAENIQAANATSVFAKIGITQQTLMGEACQRIKDGKESIILVSGGEAKFRQLQATIQNVDISDTTQTDDVEADVVMQPSAELWLLEETTAGLGMPVSYYSVMESAYRCAKGQSIDDNRDKLAEIYHHFSKAAAVNSHAWKQEEISAEYIRNASEKNPMLSFPYTKLHNTSWNVNQACAMFFTSVEKAQELGIDESHWIYPHVSSENNAMLAVAQRPDIHRSIGAEKSAQAALAHTGLTANDINIVDLYSCFPVAVEMYADAFGLTDTSNFSCTGGMPFAGGPLNNYALQAACRVFELLHEDENAIGLTSSVSGLITKQGFGLWSKKAPSQPFALIDVSDEVLAEEKPLDVIGTYHGEAVITGYTITYHKGQPQRAIAICDLPDGRRTVSHSDNPELMATIEASEFVGKTVTINDRELIL